MGGGTGSGAAPIVAEIASETGALVIAFVTMPFTFEGGRRVKQAEEGLQALRRACDAVIPLSNDVLLQGGGDSTGVLATFAQADAWIGRGVKSIWSMLFRTGLINLDFADIKSVISEMGKAMMGTGEAEGEDRAQKAADLAICNPLLDDVTMKGARGVLINITGGPDLMLFEVEQAANRVRAEVDPDANIIFGNTILDSMEGRIRVSVVATGIEQAQIARNAAAPAVPAVAAPAAAGGEAVSLLADAV